MNGVTLLDTGPLVSFLSDEDEHRAWVQEQWKQLRPPMLTCEPVLTEAVFLLKREGADTDPLFALLERGIIRLDLSIGTEGDAAGAPPVPSHAPHGHGDLHAMARAPLPHAPTLSHPVRPPTSSESPASAAS